MLEITDLTAGYGPTPVLFGMKFAIAPGEVATLIGRNGMGKTTTVKTITGMIKPSSGMVRFQGEAISGAKAHRIARAGIGLVPEGRHIFPNLSVRENLVATAANRLGAAEPWTLDRVLALFPSLAKRLSNRGNQLSGGEQQMLAVGRALMTNPRLLILDEATEGLAPLIRTEIWNCLAMLKETGLAILVIDKNIDALAKLADRHWIVEKGRVAWNGSSADLLADPELKTRYLGV